MRLLKHIINRTLWSLLGLTVALILLIQLAPVQRWLGQRVADAIGSKLGTEVSVGRVDFGFFNRLIIDDVRVLDQQQSPLLTADRLSVKLELWPLLTSGRVSIASAQLFGATAVLRRDSAEAVPNYQFAMDALSSGNDGPSKLQMHIGSLIVRRLAVSYDQLDAPTTPGRFNPRHLHIADLSAHVLLPVLTNDSINLHLHRLALREQSGLDLSHLAFTLEANRQHALLTQLAVQMPQTALAIDTLQAAYQLDSLVSTLRYRLCMAPSRIALMNVKSLLPQDIPFEQELQIDAAPIEGTLSTISVPRLALSSADGQLDILASGRIAPDEWEAKLTHLHADEHLLAQLRDFWPQMPAVLDRVGDVGLSLQAAGNGTSRLAGQGIVSSGAGALSWQGDYQDGPAPSWNMRLSTDSLDLRRITGSDLLGLVATQLNLKGAGNRISVQGQVPRIDLKGYRYRQLDIDGIYSPTAVEGHLAIADPHLQTDVELSVQRSTFNNQRVTATGRISHIAPQALHLSNQWGDAVFSAILDADVAGTSLGDAEGTIDLDDFVMVSGDTARYHLDNLHLRSGYDDGRHFLRMNSDFGEALLTGQFNLATLPSTFLSLLPIQQTNQTPQTHPQPLPGGRGAVSSAGGMSNGKTIYSPPSQGGVGGGSVGVGGGSANDFTLYVRLSDSRWMQQLLGLLLDLGGGRLDINAQVNAPARMLDIRVQVPAFNFAGNDLRNATLNLTSQGDSAQCTLRMTRHTDKGNTQDLLLTAKADGEQLASTINISTPQADHGTINTITRFYTNDDGKAETHVRVLPSQFIIKNATWELEPCDILYSDKRLMVDQFTLHHADEHLIIDGLASTQTSDSLMIDLNGFDVAYLLDLANFRSVKFGGKASGRAYVSQVFDQLLAWANITVDDFIFQEARMGTLEAFAEWDADEGQVNLEAVVDDGADAQTFVDGFISPRKKTIDLGIRARGSSLAFVHSFTKSFVSHIDGQVQGDIRVHGPLKEINLTGEAVVQGQAAISPLGTVYHFEGDSVILSPGEITFRQFRALDRDNHEALMSGAIHHKNLKNFTFDLEVDADRILAYDFPRPEAVASIGGTVWAEGKAIMRGRPGEVVIDVDATPTPGSVFYYNAAGPDAISQQRFITWGDEQRAESAELKDVERSTLNVQRSPLNPPPASDLRMNLRINATPDAQLRLLMDQHSGEAISLAGLGVLRAAYYNKGAFQLFGTYNVDRGTYGMTIQNIIKKNFTFQPGSSIVFGGDPFQAALNLKALHTVNGVTLSDLGLDNSFTSNTIRVNCLMNIVGTAGEPRVEFDLEMPTLNSEEQQMIRSIIASEQELNQQVVYLLGIGRFYTQTANNAASQSYGQTELAMQSLLSGTVSSQINQLLAQVIRNDDWNFGANISTGNEGWHNAEYEGLVSGRMLNNRLLVNGQFGYRDNATQAMPSFIGDFDIQYLLTPAGSISLKAYNKTNDRYFTHSSLNTQGIGVILKKDFNGLGDLFQSRKRKR